MSSCVKAQLCSLQMRLLTLTGKEYFDDSDSPLEAVQAKTVEIAAMVLEVPASSWGQKQALLLHSQYQGQEVQQ